MLWLICKMDCMQLIGPMMYLVISVRFWMKVCQFENCTLNFF